MRRSLPLHSAFLVVILLIVPACSSGGGEPLGPAATLGTAPTTTTTTAPPVDPAVIPDDPADIDEAYVQAVVDALFAVDAKATAIFFETKQVDERGVDYLRAIYTREEIDRQVNTWAQSLPVRGEELLPGTLGNDVQRVIDVRADCVYLEVVRDYSETTTRDAPTRLVYLGLTPKIEGDDPNRRNPTAWMMFMDGFNEGGGEPENPCEGR